MADIKQAAKWLGEGRTVSRAEYASEWWVSAFMPNLLQLDICSADGPDHQLDCQDLLADDWEIAE
jgi:hypothetical protein